MHVTSTPTHRMLSVSCTTEMIQLSKSVSCTDNLGAELQSQRVSDAGSEAWSLKSHAERARAQPYVHRIQGS